MCRSVAIIFAILTICLFCPAALAEKRVALVIGNSGYQHVARLSNPTNDAAAMAAMLKAAGFDSVDLRTDLEATDMLRALRDFGNKTRDAGIAVIYYAGHGIELNGNNYLIPVNARLETDTDIYDEALSLDRVLVAVEPAKQVRLIILDACRDNPFSTSMKRTVASRAIGRGLAKVEPTSPNTMIAFAAKAGLTASDGDGKNSPFATALAKHLPTPGLDLRRAFGFVRDDVLKATENKQEPYIYGSLGGDDVPLVPTAAQPAPNPEVEIRHDYELALQLGTREGWNAFLAKFPGGFYADLARGQLNKIASEEARLAATEKARLAQEEKLRLAAEGAKEAELATAATRAKAAEEARLAAEKAKQIEQEKFAAAEKARAAAEKGAAEKAAAEANKAAEARVLVEKVNAEKLAVMGAKAHESDPLQQVASLPAETAAASPEPSSQDLARSVQSELKRVGCFAGSIDGEWNAASQRSLDMFNKRVGTKLDVKLVSIDILNAVKKRTSRICPLICEPGYKANENDDACTKIICKAGYEIGDKNECERTVTKKPFAADEAPRKRAVQHRMGSAGARCFSFGGKSYCE